MSLTAHGGRVFHIHRSNLTLRDPWLAALLLAVVVQGATYALAIPPWQAPDEPAHFELAQLIAQHGRLVGPEDRGATFELAPNIAASLERNRFYEFIPWAERARVLSGHQFGQPQLYYALLAPLLSLSASLPVESQLLLLRLANLPLAVATVWAAYACMAILYSGDSSLALAAAAFVGLWPMRGHIGASVNNDNLAVLVVSLTLFGLTMSIVRGVTPGRVAALAALVVLAYFSKRVALITWPLVLVGLGLAWWLHRRSSERGEMDSPSQAGRSSSDQSEGKRGNGGIGFSSRLLWGRVLAVGFLAFGGASLGWLWLGGSAAETLNRIALEFYQRVFYSTYVPKPGALVSAALPHLSLWAGYLFRSFWGSFGHLTANPPVGWFVSMRLASALLGLGALVYVARLVLRSCLPPGEYPVRTGLLRRPFGAPRNDEQRSPNEPPPQPRVELAVLVVYALSILLVLLAIVLIYGHNLVRADDPSVAVTLPQGRYLFPVLIPLGAFAVLGLRQWLPGRGKDLIGLLVAAALAGLNILFLLGVVAPYYR